MPSSESATSRTDRQRAYSGMVSAFFSARGSPDWATALVDGGDVRVFWAERLAPIRSSAKRRARMAGGVRETQACRREQRTANGATAQQRNGANDRRRR